MTSPQPDDWNPKIEMAIRGLFLTNLLGQRETTARLIGRLVHELTPLDLIDHVLTFGNNIGLAVRGELWQTDLATGINLFAIDTSDLDQLDQTDEQPDDGTGEDPQA